ncbi:MAG: aspartate--tRNA(Asn) ligase [Anaerolineaceae bacterium]|nr:aspartate--tRNA(Asn) ligase [Anaerolineaceae bacterium]
MERTMIGDLKEKIGQTVQISGWLQVLRDQKSMQFLVMRDGSGLVQVAHWKKGDLEMADKISILGTESALTLTGKVVENASVKLGGLEIQLESISVENAAEIPLPFEPFGDTLPGVDFRMDWRYLDLRREDSQLIFKIQTTAEMAMREYWIKNGFMEIHSPKIMGTPSESGAELFELVYFDRKAYLAQSPQFYKQMAMAAGFDRVFEVGPVFRADPSFTSRHMTEFTGLDLEMSWINDHHDVMDFIERWIQYTYQRVKDVHGEEIERVLGHELVVPTVPFPRIPMLEAIEIVKEMGYDLPTEKTMDLDPGGERTIAQYVKEKFGHDFVYVIDWPKQARPFYHMRHPDNQDLTRSFDLLATGLEICTGAQREHRADILASQATELGLGLEAISFYLDFFKYGCPPHGGMGMGLSRLLMVMLGLSNIREAVYLFRGPNRLNP